MVAEISAKDVKALRDQTGAGMMDCKTALKDGEGDVERAMDLLRERGLSKAVKRAGRATSEGAVAVSIDGGFGVMIELGCETDFVAKNDQFQKLVQGIADALRASGDAIDVESALAAKIESETVDEYIKAAVGRVGENIQLKRVGSIRVDGIVGSYIHGGGKLGVMVGLTSASPEAVAGAAKDLAMHVAAADPTPMAVNQDGLDPSVVEKERTILRNQALESGKPENIVENMVNGRLKKFFAESCLVEQAFVKNPDQSVGEFLASAGEASVSEFLRFKLGEDAE
ncbi:MAG TPA: elongation factor Ts [Myxococcales bacterium]|nr:elongation factor Ts [Myxococcales bacterium]HIL01791.1 elongation factor Ts [Myxococcales bacterium]